MKNKLEDYYQTLVRAEQRLQEAVRRDIAEDPIILDGTIQRFEFTYELLWKFFKRLLLTQGIEANSPRAAFKQAYQQQWIENEVLWLKMLDDRNRTSHTYQEQTAQIIYQHIKQDYAPALHHAVGHLQIVMTKSA